jgi:hypothetical protein
MFMGFGGAFGGVEMVASGAPVLEWQMAVLFNQEQGTEQREMEIVAFIKGIREAHFAVDQILALRHLANTIQQCPQAHLEVHLPRHRGWLASACTKHESSEASWACLGAPP